MCARTLVVSLLICVTFSFCNGEIINGTATTIYRYLLRENHNVTETVEISFGNAEGPEGIPIPYRVEVSSSGAERNYPVFVVVRQQKHILSWQLPLMVETANPNAPNDFIEYVNTGRTLCHSMAEYKGTETKLKSSKSVLKSGRVFETTTNFIVSLSTFSPVPVWVTLQAEPVKDYFIETGKFYNATFSPSEPVYFAYQFPNNDVKTVHLKVTSEDNTCFSVSVQPHICPIYDLLDHITYQGKYQTVQNNGGLAIYRKDFENDNIAAFVIVFVAHADNYECDTDAAVPFAKQARFKENRQFSKVQFSVRASKKKGEYGIAIFSLLGFNLVLCVVIGILTYLFYRFGRYYRTLDVTDNKRVSVADVIITDKMIAKIHEDPEPKLAEFIQRTKRNRRVALNYFWHIANIAIFYGLPVIQLMVFYQRAVNYSGDLDLCYYNNQCSHPLYFNDFNHVYSNLGYVLFGILFLAVTAFRNYKQRNSAGCGIPKLYGLYYAMGVALIFEGVLSGCYHICPNQSNFQFDTSFMYVMAMLIMAKLYQNRHPDYQAGAYSTFTILGISVTIAMFGILFNSLPVLIVFFVLYVFFCVYMAFKLYFFANVITRVNSIYRNIRREVGVVEGLKPIRLKLFIFVIVGLLINFAMAISGFFLYPDRIDFGTYLLVILMGNAILYSTFYVSMKIANNERICFEAMLYGFLALVLWIAGGYFFFNAATVWSKTPAQSRLLNKDCLIFDFYDTHDIWHILSAPALFFTFCFLGAMDDDLVQTSQKEINVF